MNQHESFDSKISEESQLYSHRNNQFDGPIGKIYIHKHHSGSMVKVGETSKSSRGRLNDYVKTWDLKGFSFHKEYLVPLDTRLEIESNAQRILRKHRIAGARGPRELFLCSVSKAEWAVSTAIKENKAVQTKRREAKAKELFHSALDKYKADALIKMRASPWILQKQSELQQFIENTSFEKEKVLSRQEKEEIGLACIGGIILGSAIIWASSYGSPLLFFIGIVCIFYNGNKLVKLGGPQPLVPDTEAIQKREAMQEAIKSAEAKFTKAAEDEFKGKFKISDFYPQPELQSLNYDYDHKVTSHD